MSRIGKKTVSIPAGVEVKFSPGMLRVKGPKGELAQEIRGGVSVEVSADGKQAQVKRAGDTSQDRAFHGLYRALLVNMVEGVSRGYSRELDVVGTGYKVSVESGKLVMQIGFSNPIKLDIPAGLTVTCPSQTQVLVSGPDKQVVGDFAARTRAKHPPDPYHQKGIRYRGEQVRKLTGKTFGSTTA